MKTETKKTGVEMPAWLHPLMKRCGAVAGYSIKDAYTEAGIDWIKKLCAVNPIVRALVDQEARDNHELKDVMTTKLSAVRKPSRESIR